MVDFTGSINNTDFVGQLGGATGMDFDAFTALLDGAGASGTAGEYQSLFDNIAGSDGILTEEEFMTAAGATGTSAIFDSEDITALGASGVSEPSGTSGAAAVNSLQPGTWQHEVSQLEGVSVFKANDGVEYIYIEPEHDTPEVHAQINDIMSRTDRTITPIDPVRNQAEVEAHLNDPVNAEKTTDTSVQPNGNDIIQFGENVYRLLDPNVFYTFLTTEDVEEPTEPQEPRANMDAIMVWLGLGEVLDMDIMNSERYFDFGEDVLTALNDFIRQEDPSHINFTRDDLENMSEDEFKTEVLDKAASLRYATIWHNFHEEGSRKIINYEQNSATLFNHLGFTPDQIDQISELSADEFDALLIDISQEIDTNTPSGIKLMAVRNFEDFTNDSFNAHFLDFENGELRGANIPAREEAFNNINFDDILSQHGIS
jgi:hypothetical protein